MRWTEFIAELLEIISDKQGEVFFLLRKGINVFFVRGKTYEEIVEDINLYSLGCTILAQVTLKQTNFLYAIATREIKNHWRDLIILIMEKLENFPLKEDSSQDISVSEKDLIDEIGFNEYRVINESSEYTDYDKNYESDIENDNNRENDNNYESDNDYEKSLEEIETK